MKTTTRRTFHALFLLSAFCLFQMPVAAQPEAEDKEEEKEAATITQGQAALLLAERLGLFTNSTLKPTQSRAIQLLTARGIAPFGGWDPEAEMTAGGFARITVYSLGLEDQLTEEQLAGEDDQPFVDLLIKETGLDVTKLRNPKTESFPTGDEEDTDPIEEPLIQGGTLILLNRTDIDRAFAILSGNGSGNQVDETSANMTPSAP